MPPYLCYRNFTLHSDCLGIVTFPEIYKYVTSDVYSAITNSPTQTGHISKVKDGTLK